MTGSFGLFERLSIPQRGMCSTKSCWSCFGTEVDIDYRFVKNYAEGASCVATTVSAAQSRRYASTRYNCYHGADNRL